MPLKRQFRYALVIFTHRDFVMLARLYEGRTKAQLLHCRRAPAGQRRGWPRYRAQLLCRGWV